ncbi:putative RNA-binding protein 19 [Sciurus carolinensis]|uniref:RNA-binding protein 19 n=1 Tax=Sciurus carolinensis TaxID=30640 RepID=A0AA41MPL0_SCICA|nr:putative RNA-binding protein 19 [Sciurus carolinensis]
MKEEQSRQLLAAFGTLTNCSFKFTKDGKFLKFGFMGLKSEEEAQTSLSHFNKSFIDSSWITDDKKRKVPSELEKGKSKPTSDYLNFDSDSGQESEEEAAEEPAVEQGLEPNTAAQKGLSDMEYLKSKMVATESSTEEESEDEAVNCDEGSEAEESSATEIQQTKKPVNEKEPTTTHTVKLREAQFSVTEGRMLNVLPSTIRKEASEDAPGSSYKKKAASKNNASSSSSHNWNMLFMSTDPLGKSLQGWTPAEFFLGKTRSALQPCGEGHPLILPIGCFLHGPLPFKTLKASLSVEETKGSVAVRVAPGETQLVQEVQHFLLHNGVSLDSFSQATAERRKTVILVKNLPAGTLATELRETFGHFGSLSRVLLPKGGVTAILVEFLEPLEVHGTF